MNKEQQVLLSLLEEVDRLCTKNKIEYYLAPRLAVHAVYGDEMPKSPLAGGILMKLSDMERFRLAYLKEERRTEPWNPCMRTSAFPDFSFGMRTKIPCAFEWTRDEITNIRESGSTFIPLEERKAQEAPFVAALPGNRLDSVLRRPFPGIYLEGEAVQASCGNSYGWRKRQAFQISVSKAL